MFHIDVGPVIFSIGGLELRWYGLMVALAVVAVVIIALREARRLCIAQETIYSVTLWAVASALVLSRLTHVIDKWGYYSVNPSQIFGFEGLTINGAIIGALLSTLIYCRVKHVSFWRLGDVVAPGAIVGQAVGRMGCVLNGCCYGAPSDSFLSIVYTNPASFGPVGIPVLPTHAFLLVWDMAVFVVLWLLRKRLNIPGGIFLLYLVMYAAGDFVIRFWRENDPFLFGFKQAQVMDLAVLAVTVPWLVVKRFRRREEVPVEVGTKAPDQAG